MVNIPRLDLNLYTEGDSRQRKQFSDDIGKAFNETGFVTITNHGMDKKLIDKLYEDVKALFVLPDEVKDKYEVPGLAGQRFAAAFTLSHHRGELARGGYSKTAIDPLLRSLLAI